MRIQHNIMALNAYRQLGGNNNALAKNLEKLSSGYRINRAGDDAAGLAISEKMRAQIKGLEAAQKNANDGISLVQTAEGALTEVHSMLNRMTYLATQSANGTYDNEVDRANLDKEFQTLKTEIDRIAQATNFNGINLLDGSMSTANLTTEGISTAMVDMANGIDITEGLNGGGSKGEYTIDLTQAFGDGDTMAITFGGAAGGAGTAGVVTLTYGTEITGSTLEKQAQSIAAALSGTANVGSNFSIVADGTTIKLTSMNEGNDATTVGTVTDVQVTNKDATKDATWAATPGAGYTTAAEYKFAKLFDGNGGTSKDIPNGSSMTFTAELENGNKLNITLTEGKDFVKGNNVSDTIDNIVKALNAGSFTDDPDSIIDESKIKVGDIFTAINDGAGGITFKSTAGSLKATAGGIKFKGADGAEVGSAAATGSAGAPAANSFLLKLGTGAADLAAGDKLTLKGELADGRTFELAVEAGKDFDIGANFAATMGNLETLLETKGIKMTLSDGSTVNSTDIFGAAADGKEIDFNTTTANTFTSNSKGTAGVSKITDVGLDVAGAAAISKSLNNGAQQTEATSEINFSKGVNYGAVVEVDGQKYEIVQSEDDLSSRKNNAVVVKNIDDPTEVAKAMAKALQDNLNGNAYTVSASGSKVTIKSVDVGSTAKGVSVSASGDKTTQLEFTLDPAKMQNGSKVTINGQTYEFVEKGGKPSDSSATAIEVADFSKATSQTLGKALADVADGVKGAKVSVDENGKVTVRGLADTNGKIETPTVKFADGKGGLTMQIGDTADDFNKIKVSIYDMHCADMGIGDTDIKTIDTAAAAIDKIKSAINYVSDVRGDLGAIQNRLEHTINNLGVQTENITAAESRIRDTDMAEEMMAYTKNNILVQAAQAMLAQANQVPQGILQLLQ